MSDASFAIGNDASSFGGTDQNFDPSAAGGFGTGFDPFGGGNLGMGDPSAMFGGGFGGSSPATTPPSTPIINSAIAGQVGQPPPSPQPKPTGGQAQGDIGSLLQSLFGGMNNAMSPSLQSLAQKGMGWFTGPGDTTGLTTPQQQGPQNDPGSVTGGGAPGWLSKLFPDMPPEVANDWNQIKSDLANFGQPPTSADASTGPTGNATTQAAQQSPPDAGITTGPMPPDAGITTGPNPPDAGITTGPMPSSTDTSSPQSAPASGNNQQPGPGDQTTGSVSSQENANQGGQYGPGSPNWQSNPMFALLDLLRGDFGSFMKDMGAQMGTPGGRNYANAPRPPQYGGSPGLNTPGPATTKGLDPDTDPFTRMPQAGVLQPPSVTPAPTQTTAAPPSGTPSAGATPQVTPAATTGSSTEPSTIVPSARGGFRRAAPAPAQTAPATPAPATPAPATPAPTSPTPAPATSANPPGSPSAPRPVPTQSYNPRANPAMQTPPANSPQATAARNQAGTSPVQEGPPAQPIAGMGAAHNGTVGRANATRPRDTHGLTGRVTINGQNYRFGSGGVNNHFSLPYGRYYLHDAAHGGVGPVGQRIGAIAGISDNPNSGNTVSNDPRTGGSRVGVEIHPSTSGYTEGCLGVDRNQWSSFSQAYRQLQQQSGGNLVLQVNPDGSASIEPARGTAIARGP